MVPTDGQSYTHWSHFLPETYFRTNKLVLYHREKGRKRKAKRKLCHSTWCPQTGNRIHVDHNFPPETHFRTNKLVLYQRKREEGKGAQRPGECWCMLVGRERGFGSKKMMVQNHSHTRDSTGKTWDGLKYALHWIQKNPNSKLFQTPVQPWCKFDRFVPGLIGKCVLRKILSWIMRNLPFLHFTQLRGWVCTYHQ